MTPNAESGHPGYSAWSSDPTHADKASAGCWSLLSNEWQQIAATKCRDQRTYVDVWTCGPGRVRIASGEDDNYFAGCASLTDMSKRGGNFVEREGVVDVDPDVPGNA